MASVEPSDTGLEQHLLDSNSIDCVSDFAGSAAINCHQMRGVRIEAGAFSTLLA